MASGVVRGKEFLDSAFQVAPFGIAVGIIAALVVSAYEQLLRAIERREH